MSQNNGYVEVHVHVPLLLIVEEKTCFSFKGQWDCLNLVNHNLAVN